ISFNEHYPLLNCLGKGAQGAVYRVVDNRNQKEYAAKRIPFAGIPFDDIKRIEREATILTQLQHPNIPKFHEFYTEQDQWVHATVLVTELIDGTSLSQHLKTNKFSEPQLQSIKSQTLEALTAAHSRGIIHRDIKPANLMITEQDKIYLTDFGIAKQLGQETRLSSLGTGTVVYMSPEQLTGQSLTHATDHYSLALTLIALASGQERSDDYRHQDPLQQLKTLTHLSPSFRESLEQMLAIDPQKRKITTSATDLAMVSSPPLVQTIDIFRPFREWWHKKKMEIIQDDLRDAYEQCVPGTMQSAMQLMKECRTNKKLRNHDFNTSDGNIYCNENGQQVWYLCSEMTHDGTQLLNPGLKNIDDASHQFKTNHNYQVLSEDFEKVKQDPHTLRVVLNNLDLQFNDHSDYTFFEISTALYHKLNPERRIVAERVYGQGNDFVKNMKMLKDAGINKTKIFMLTPAYVQKHAKDGPIGRMSWLSDFYRNSDFRAYGDSMEGRSNIRGIRREVTQSTSLSFLTKHKSILSFIGLAAAASFIGGSLAALFSSSPPEEVCSVTYNEYEPREPTRYVSRFITRTELERIKESIHTSNLKVLSCY